MRKSDDKAVLYRTNENTGQTPGAPMDSGQSSETDTDELDPYTKGLVEFVCLYTAEKLAERDRKIQRLETQLETVLTLMGKSTTVLNADSKSATNASPDWRADVVELPRFLRPTQDNAA